MGFIWNLPMHAGAMAKLSDAEEFRAPAMENRT